VSARTPYNLGLSTQPSFLFPHFLATSRSNFEYCQYFILLPA
jgi:hypothetical protein